ncbi:universal stress protein [Actinoplanes sp. KI2]|uniref:universal stress protein n=1 Tax=Actinoplanes sp. KI2 TaxID=2983315 RepID=UPI0021D5810B|nr:universal stress protein [Actinoplanes sp. KI2]MCU7729398.1 universal stress protein [Actinoplanes sp. KI2]
MRARDRSVNAVPVVVGVDGSVPSLAAVDLAAQEAVLRRCGLRLVHALASPYPQFPAEGWLRPHAENILGEAWRHAHEMAPDLPIDGEIITGQAGTVLRDCSRTARLVVVGDRGASGFGALLVGSVAVQMAAHAACPILVARGEADRESPVLLGVDGSSANDPAVGFAFEEAALRGVPLVAEHAWAHPVSTGPGDMLPLVYDVSELGHDEERLLSEALAGWQAKYPDVVVERKLVRGGARPALIEATRHAQLVVVGSRGRGGFTGLLLGSVSQAVLHHADCPVAIVPHPQPAN